jgi:hypothetical protein
MILACDQRVDVVPKRQEDDRLVALPCCPAGMTSPVKRRSAHYRPHYPGSDTHLRFGLHYWTYSNIKGPSASPTLWLTILFWLPMNGYEEINVRAFVNLL